MIRVKSQLQNKPGRLGHKTIAGREGTLFAPQQLSSHRLADNRRAIRFWNKARNRALGRTERFRELCARTHDVTLSDDSGIRRIHER